MARFDGEEKGRARGIYGCGHWQSAFLCPIWGLVPFYLSPKRFSAPPNLRPNKLRQEREGPKGHLCHCQEPDHGSKLRRQYASRMNIARNIASVSYP
jgi:hypothetical protein